MTAPAPEKIWWTCNEIAAECLPDLPSARQALDRRIAREGWQAQPEFARRRKGRGGGWEYHWKLFPLRAQKALLSTVEVDEAAPALSRDEAWRQFEELPEAVKAKARNRLAVLDQVAALEEAGLNRSLAIAEVSAQQSDSPRTIWNWLSLVEGVCSDDRLAYLAPKHRTAARKVKVAAFSHDWFEFLKSDYLRQAQPSFSACYRRAVRVAKQKGWAPILTERTALRRLQAEVPRVTMVFAREGHAGMQRCFPPQIRDREALSAMEAVNADCHKFDVAILWPGADKPSRAQLIAFQDLYSGKLLAWRIDDSPNKVAVMSAFGDMVEKYGIPKRCLFDNGREFANKWLTGGAPTRFRFKIREDDPLGVLPQLGITLHWATPGHGQAKPIERSFRDLAQDIAKDPRFEGAYLGNNPGARPENCKRAVDLSDFVAVVDELIEEHNARLGRLSATARGRSFDETFAASYASAPVRKATEEQRRLWLMGQEVRKLHKNHGEAIIHGNRYWADWMNEFAGQKVILRFNPEQLHAGVYVYATDGAFMGFAACREKVGFFDVASARAHARDTARIRKAERDILNTHRQIKARELGAVMNGLEQPQRARPEAKVIKMMPKPVEATPKAPAPVAQHLPGTEAMIAKLQHKTTKKSAAETPQERFKRAREIEARAEAGLRVGEAEAQWVSTYRDSPEYRAMARMAAFEQKSSG